MLYRLSAKQLRKKFIEGDLTAETIVSYFLARIERHDKKLGAFLSIYKERALEKARLLDKKRTANQVVGKLAAIPFALKDNIHVKGELTTCASKFLTNYRAPFSATVTELLENHDAIVLGKTNLDEFAMGSSNENSALQATHNPWNLSYVPGGSSGGSAVAVAARLCPIAFGSDTGGSVRLPAAFCGVFGFKPTYGRVSRYGLVAFGSSLDQIGTFATTAEDVGLIMELIGVHDPKDATSLTTHPDEHLNTLAAPIQGKKIGVPWEFLQQLPPETKNNFDQIVATLKALGCQIVDIDLNILHYSLATYYIIASAEASTNLARFDGVRYGVRSPRAQTLSQLYQYSKQEGYGPEVKRRILIGTYVLSADSKDAYYKRATKVRVKMIQTFEKIFQNVDVVLMPSSSGAAFARDGERSVIDLYLQDIFTICANLVGLPAISVPCGFDAHGMPYGVQFIGNRRDDALVVRLAHAYSQQEGHSNTISPLFDRE